jgi:hypothetical protein
MLERADARLWFPMIGIAGAVPAVVFAISAISFMRFYFAPPTILAAAPLGSSALAQVEVAVPPPPVVPVAPPLAAQTPKPLSTMPRLGDAHPAYSDPAQDISTVVSAAMSAKPAALEPPEPIADPVPPALAEAEAPAPQLRQQPTETAEVVAAPPDAKASELASAPPAVASRMRGDAHPAYSDPALDISTVVSAAMSAKPAALEPSEPIADPAPPALAEAEAPAPQLRQQPPETAEVVVALPDAKASELASAPPAVAPRMRGDAHPAYSDPAQDISTLASAVMSTEPAALKPSKPIEGPIPLPRPKPSVTVVHVSRTVSSARSPTVASSPRPTSGH